MFFGIVIFYSSSPVASFLNTDESFPPLLFLAFPCNNFGGQEPGTNAEVLAFARNKGFTAPVLGKLECQNGDKTHVLYQKLTSSISGGWLGAGLKWNFAKFLCDSNGVPRTRYLPTTSPLSMESDIKRLLENKDADFVVPETLPGAPAPTAAPAEEEASCSMKPPPSAAAGGGGAH